jgi:hypothetical protein
MQRGDAALVTRLRRAETELAAERIKRLAAEQKAAGLRSAVVRMQAMLARLKADDAECRAANTARS